MLFKLRTFLKAPSFDDDDLSRRAAILNAVLLVTILILAVSSIPNALTNPDVSGTFLAHTLIVVGLIFLYLLMRRGYILSVSLLLVGSLWLIVTAATATRGGVDSPHFGAEIGLVVVAGLLLGVRGALLIAIFNSLAVLVITAAIENGQLPAHIGNTQLNQAVIQVSLYMMVALFLYIATSRLDEAFTRVRSNAALAKSTLDELRATSVNRDYVDNILQSMSNLLVTLNPDGTIQTVNRATLKLLNYSETELIGQPFLKIALGVSADSMRRKTTQAVDATFIAKEGHQIPVMLSSALLMRDGVAEGVVCIAEDMTLRYQAQDQRKRDELRYRALFDQTTDAVFILDLSGKHIAINQRAADMLGYTADELLQLLYRDIVGEIEIDKTDTTVQALVDGERVPTHERIFRRKDGTEFPAEVSAQLVRDETGNPIHIQRIARDITERRQIDEQLHYQADLLQNVSDAIISTRLDSTIRSWNKAAEYVYGWKAEEVIGRSLTDVVRTTFGNEANEDAIKRQYFARGYWRSEVTQQRKDGQVLHILSSVSLLRDSNGRPQGTVAVNHDITKRKLAELELQKRLDQLATLRQIDSEIGSTLDLDKVLLFALNAAVSLAGAEAGFILITQEQGNRIAGRYGKYAEVEDQHPVVEIDDPLYGITGRAMKTLQPQFVPDVKNDPAYYADLPDTQALMAIPLISHDRLIGIIDLETTQQDHFTPEVFDFVQLIGGRLAAAIDNARLYQVSQQQLSEMQKLYDEISKLEQLKTDMIRIASHDLRNPVGVINGYLELLRKDIYDRLSESEIDYIETISRQVDRMQHIIDDILSLERIQQVAKAQIAERIDLHELIDKVVRNHRAEAEHKFQELDIKATDEILTVEGDSTQLYEAISNLVTNAIKYTPDGGSVSIALQQVDNNARVEVRDTGYGIPEEQQPRLFEPFFRAKMKETAEIGGTGLGLHLVKNIVERHAGKIMVESVYGTGSTFSVELPLVKTPRLVLTD